MNIGATGRNGEDMVAAFLRKKGYIIVKQNYQSRYGEIDIIAERNTYIVFVEVKTRKEGAPVSGFESVDLKKQERLRKTALEFIAKLHVSRLQPRFDVASVTVFKKADGSDGYALEYLENAF